MKRKAILGCDTDSNFVGLEKYFKFVESKFNYKNYDINREYGIANSAILYLANFIQKELNRFTANCNLTPEKQPIIRMKSEFLYRKMMFTRNKKQYAGLLIGREGHIIDPPKLDMKGMSIKKSTVNNTTRSVFNNIIYNDILNSKKINYFMIFLKYRNLESIIRDSLSNGNTEFLKPDKVNEFSSYAFPERMMVVRGTFIWNYIYPNESIQLPTKINILKLKENSLDLIEDDEIKNKILEAFSYYENKKSNSKIEREFFEKMAKIKDYGLSVLALPKNIEKIPDWVIPLIDYDSIIDDNIRVGNLIIESIGGKLMSYNNQEFYSSFINF
jgi:hypothetical protein